MRLRPLKVCIPSTKVEQIEVALCTVELNIVLLEQITGTADITNVAHALTIEIETYHRILDTTAFNIDVCRLYNDGNSMFLALLE